MLAVGVVVAQVIVMHRIVMHRIAMHRIAMHRIAMHRIVMHRIVMHRIEVGDFWLSCCSSTSVCDRLLSSGKFVFAIRFDPSCFVWDPCNGTIRNPCRRLQTGNLCFVFVLEIQYLNKRRNWHQSNCGTTRR